MHRKLIVMTLLATPALAAGQHPADSAREHPASSAHANAMAGAAAAERIEACSNAVDSMIRTLEIGDVQGATSDFDAAMKTSLPPDKLGGFWKQVEGQMGKLQTLGPAQNMMYQGHVVIVQPVHFEKGDATAQVACDADGRIAGFFLRPVAPAPASSD